MIQDCPACRARTETRGPVNDRMMLTEPSEPVEVSLSYLGKEVTYATYTRVKVARNEFSWKVDNGVAENLVAISFPTFTDKYTIMIDSVDVYVPGASKPIATWPSPRMPILIALSHGAQVSFAAGSLRFRL